jgi:hypothetical protein
MIKDKVCSECKARGKIWNGSDPKCAFTGGAFNEKNWNCATVNILRFIIEAAFDDDHTTKVIRHPAWKCRNDGGAGTIGVLLIPEEIDLPGYIVMTWYKNRGKTEQAWVINDSNPPRALTIQEAELVITFFRDKYHDKIIDNLYDI